MMRCAIYARYSTDSQSERSIPDQFAVCTRYAVGKDWQIVETFSDAAISGSATANRPGLQAALKAASQGKFDILLAEDEDRISRSLEHLANCNNRLLDAGACLWTISSGRVENMHVALKGLISEEFLKNLSAKTKRGMRSNAEKGLATGSRLYGYRGAEGGLMTIVEPEAEIIRRIFDDYAAGDTARDIAVTLNGEGIPGPRGGQWNQSTITGSRKRGNGILRTELYNGVKVWNRVEVKKDRNTGQRKDTVRPEAEWQRTDVPHLRIVDEDVWAKVQARQQRASQEPQKAQRRPRLFSGLLKCGLCGGTYSIYTSGKLVCTAQRDKGTCTNKRTPKLADVEARVLSSLREKMLSPEAVATYVRAYRDAQQARKSDLSSRQVPLEKRLGEVRRGIERVVDAIVEGTANDAMKARMKALDEERLSIEATLQELHEERPVITLHPGAPERYAAMIDHLQETLGQIAIGETRAQRELLDAVRGLIDKVEIIPLTQERGGPIDIVLHGTLASFMKRPEQPENSGLAVLVVGGGIEPPTCGL